MTDTSRYYDTDESACEPCLDRLTVPNLLLGLAVILAVVLVLMWARFKPHRSVRFLAWLTDRVMHYEALLSQPRSDEDDALPAPDARSGDDVYGIFYTGGTTGDYPEAWRRCGGALSRKDNEVFILREIDELKRVAQHNAADMGD